MSERERFEAWARTQPRHEGASMRFLALNNAYIDFDLHGAWLAWQAARSGQAASGSSQGARSDDLKNLADALTRFYANTPVWAPEDRMTLAEAARLIRSLADSPASAAAARVGQPEAPTAAPLEQAVAAERNAWRTRLLECSRHMLENARAVAKFDEQEGRARELAASYVGKVARTDAIVERLEHLRAALSHPPARSGAGSEEGQG